MSSKTHDEQCYLLAALDAAFIECIDVIDDVVGGDHMTDSRNVRRVNPLQGHGDDLSEDFPTFDIEVVRYQQVDLADGESSAGYRLENGATREGEVCRDQMIVTDGAVPIRAAGDLRGGKNAIARVIARDHGGAAAGGHQVVDDLALRAARKAIRSDAQDMLQRRFSHEQAPSDSQGGLERIAGELRNADDRCARYAQFGLQTCRRKPKQRRGINE